MDFDRSAKEVGFSNIQIEFFREWFAQVGHNHTTDDIVGLEQVVEEIVEANEDTEEDGEDEE